MIVGSLFSGIGGFDLAAELEGCSVCWQVEYNAQAQSILRAHWPGIPLHKDVCDVGADTLDPVELLVGGFPCQDLSVAGNRAGLAGERSGLFFEFMRIAGELRPRWVLIENVPGLFSSGKGEDLTVVLETLAELGYGWAYRVLDSQYFGVAQRRRRVFIVGRLGDRPPGEVLFEPESCSGDPAPSREARKGAARSAQGGAGADGEIAGTVASKWAKGTGGPAGDEVQNLVAHTLRGESFDASEDGTGRGTPLVVTPPLLASGRGTARTGESRGQDPLVVCRPTTDYRTGAYEECEASGTLTTGTDMSRATPLVVDPSPVYSIQNRAVAENLAPTLTVGGRDRGAGDSTDNTPSAAGPGLRVRRLTPRECERLQGFPDDWTRFGLDADHQMVEQADTPRYKQLGNAVTVPVIRWIVRRIQLYDLLYGDRE